MIKRANSAGGVYLLKRAAQLAKRVVAKYGRKTEIIDGFIVEGRRANKMSFATVLEPPGEMVGFGNEAGGVMERVYPAPMRDVFDPNQPGAAYGVRFMTGEREVVPRYRGTEDQPPTAHVIGPTPPVDVFPIRLTEGVPFDGDRGLYCCSLVTSKATWPVLPADDMWLEVHFHAVGPNDGRKGAIIHRSVLEALVPGHVLFLGANNSLQPRFGLSWPHSDADEYEDGVVIATFLRQAIRADPNAREDSYCSAVLVYYLNLKTGTIEWSQVYDFTQASHPMFRREIATAWLNDAHRAYWTEQDAGRLAIEHHGGQITVVFGIRSWRPILRQPVDGDTPEPRWYIRKFFGQCRLAVTPSSITDTWHHVDCWCSPQSAAMDEIPGADPAFMELIEQAADPMLLHGKAYYTSWVVNRPTDDYRGHLTRNVGVRMTYHPDYQRLYFDGQLMTTTAQSRLVSDYANNGNALHNPYVYLSGYATRRSRPFTAWLGGNKLAYSMFRMDGLKQFVIVIVDGPNFTMWRPFGDATAPSNVILGRHGVNCPQRQVLDSDDNVVVPYLLIVHAIGTVEGVEKPLVCLRRGDAGLWYTYTADVYADRGVAYVGNPLMVKPYGRLFEQGPT